VEAGPLLVVTSAGTEHDHNLYLSGSGTDCAAHLSKIDFLKARTFDAGRSGEVDVAKVHRRVAAPGLADASSSANARAAAFKIS
jgi:hypothetical protein